MIDPPRIAFTEESRAEDEALYTLHRFAEGREGHASVDECPTFMEFARRNPRCAVCLALTIFDRDGL